MTPTTVNGRPLIVTTRPTRAGSAPNFRRQTPSLSSTTCNPAGVSSATEKSRPIAGFTPSVRKKLAATRIPLMRSASPLTIRVGAHERISVIWSKLWLRSRQSRNVVKPTFPATPVGPRSPMSTSRSGSAYGSGRSSTAFRTLKIAVLAPIPSASVSSATAVKPGARSSRRAA